MVFQNGIVDLCSTFIGETAIVASKVKPISDSFLGKTYNFAIMGIVYKLFSGYLIYYETNFYIYILHLN